MTLEEKFEQVYAKVFTEENTVRTCGRDECKKLIKLAVEMDNSNDFGNINTGCMNINNVVKLHERIIGK